MMKRSISLIIALSFFTLISTVFAQGYTLNISPTSGPPGTNVTLSPNPTYADERCFANGAATGRNYTVPGGASGTITFYCEAGTGEFYSRTNDATFTVTQPDSDGDGIPDSQDTCPNQHFQGGNGCPPQEPAEPQPQQPPQQPDQPAPDRDGDGIPDSQDACPDQHFQGGNGCPPQEPAEPQPQSAPDSDGDGVPDPDDMCPNSIGTLNTNGCDLPSLPPEGEGPCLVAPGGGFRVNLRETPGLNGQVIDRLEPELIEIPLAFYPDDGGWFLLSHGWASQEVLNVGGDCSILPEGDPDGGVVSEPTAEPPEEECPSYYIVYMRGEGELDNPLEFLQSITESGVLDPVVLESVIVDGEFVPDVTVDDNIFIGGPCGELVLGTSGTDLIDGRGGNDRIYGFEGDDLLLGGDGDDGILGGPGDDLIIGGDGWEWALGEEGNDRIYGNDGDDRIYGMQDDDRIYGGHGDDYLYGGPGSNWINGGPGTNQNSLTGP